MRAERGNAVADASLSFGAVDMAKKVRYSGSDAFHRGLPLPTSFLWSMRLNRVLWIGWLTWINWEREALFSPCAGGHSTNVYLD
eukprot:8296015-Pyramimonas_sp.AAC.1